jgi:hypothetical protein
MVEKKGIKRWQGRGRRERGSKREQRREKRPQEEQKEMREVPSTWEEEMLGTAEIDLSEATNNQKIILNK